MQPSFRFLLLVLVCVDVDMVKNHICVQVTSERRHRPRRFDHSGYISSSFPFPTRAIDRKPTQVPPSLSFHIPPSHPALIFSSSRQPTPYSPRPLPKPDAPAPTLLHPSYSTSSSPPTFLYFPPPALYSN